LNASFSAVTVNCFVTGMLTFFPKLSLCAEKIKLDLTLREPAPPPRAEARAAKPKLDRVVTTNAKRKKTAAGRNTLRIKFVKSPYWGWLSCALARSSRAACGLLISAAGAPHLSLDKDCPGTRPINSSYAA
jgi:hypothetical protein